MTYETRPRGPQRAAGPEKRRRSKAATVFLVFGIAWLAAGLGMLGWVAYELFGTNIGVRDEYNKQIGELEQLWSSPAPSAEASAAPEGEATEGADGDGEGDDLAEQVTAPLIQYNLGNGFAILRIPKLKLEVPIIAGDDDASLAKGVGWATYTALPGQEGNFVVAGHHSSRGHPFDNLQSLVAGDEFTVETQTMIYTYRLLNSPADLTVDYTETWVTLADPFLKSSTPSGKYATLLTCKEFFSTPYRSVGFAELVAEQSKY
ncbi:MAG: sortase [Propionibacteriaceae bacterium]|jgi:sortase A|nr:sortase [Propionibacteriaceae bacterium]